MTQQRYSDSFVVEASSDLVSIRMTCARLECMKRWTVRAKFMMVSVEEIIISIDKHYDKFHPGTDGTRT